ncbi:hypothetical protein G5V59_09785 [Nocardioides sp. W3-2-3]|uniref:hypothetical protein n=1 Tax=Nocardioides convexus TaxID=2712224 RepID=UPI00241873C7|nr:hypothetical protein [Nocardioides convexus]NHA00299.1 hypothetical protein [Nocardioides convexus]
MDEVAVYSHGLSAGEVTDHFKAAAGTKQAHQGHPAERQGHLGGELRRRDRPRQGVHRPAGRHLDARRTPGLRHHDRHAPHGRREGPGRPRLPLRVRRARRLPAALCAAQRQRGAPAGRRAVCGSLGAGPAVLRARTGRPGQHPGSGTSPAPTSARWTTTPTAR